MSYNDLKMSYNDIKMIYNDLKMNDTYFLYDDSLDCLN